MTFNFETCLEGNDEYEDLTHLQESARLLGLETPEEAFGINEDMEAEAMVAIKEEIKERVEAEMQRLEAEAEAQRLRDLGPTCHIGPYSGGYCTICGLRDPN